MLLNNNPLEKTIRINSEQDAHSRDESEYLSVEDFRFSRSRKEIASAIFIVASTLGLSASTAACSGGSEQVVASTSTTTIESTTTTETKLVAPITFGSVNGEVIEAITEPKPIIDPATELDVLKGFISNYELSLNSGIMDGAIAVMQSNRFEDATNRVNDLITYRARWDDAISKTDIKVLSMDGTIQSKYISFTVDWQSYTFVGGMESSREKTIRQILSFQTDLEGKWIETRVTDVP